MTAQANPSSHRSTDPGPDPVQEPLRRRRSRLATVLNDGKAIIIGLLIAVLGMLIKEYLFEDGEAREPAPPRPAAPRMNAPAPTSNAPSATPAPERLRPFKIVSPLWDARVYRCVKDIEVRGDAPAGFVAVLGVLVRAHRFTAMENGPAGEVTEAHFVTRPLEPGHQPGTWKKPVPPLAIGAGGEAGKRETGTYPVVVYLVPEELAREISADPAAPPVYDRAHLMRAGIKRVATIDVTRLPDTTKRC